MKPRKIGYARVSTDDQNLNTQIDFLNQMGCDLIYQEKRSATSKERIELQKALKSLKKDDTLIVLKLDRLGRSVMDLLPIIKFPNRYIKKRYFSTICIKPRFIGYRYNLSSFGCNFKI